MTVNVLFDGELELIVTGTHEPSQRQTMTESGYDESFEIDSVFTAHGDDITSIFDFDYIDGCGRDRNRARDLEELVISTIYGDCQDDLDDE
jgi:hypothetical protein